MNLERVESHLTTLERLALYLTQHGCDLSAQDAARALMRYFDEGPHPSPPGDGLLEHENRALGRSYAGLRERLRNLGANGCRLLPLRPAGARAGPLPRRAPRRRARALLRRLRGGRANDRLGGARRLLRDPLERRCSAGGA